MDGNQNEFLLKERQDKYNIQYFFVGNVHNLFNSEKSYMELEKCTWKYKIESAYNNYQGGDK